MRKINKNYAITPINLSICDLMVSNGTLPYARTTVTHGRESAYIRGRIYINQWKKHGSAN